MSWTLLGWCLAGLLGVALAARWLRLGESRISTEERAREIAEQMLVGFVAHAVLLGIDGNAALVAGNGAVALLMRRGVSVAARRLLAPLRLTQAVEGMTVDTGAQAFGSVLLFGVTEGEVRALEAAIAPARDLRLLTIH